MIAEFGARVSSASVCRRIAIDRSDPAKPRMVLGDEALARCSSLVAESDGIKTVHGPFSGAPASDERWIVSFFYGPRWVVAFVDDKGIPRFARDLGFELHGEETGMGTSAQLLGRVSLRLHRSRGVAGSLSLRE